MCATFFSSSGSVGIFLFEISPMTLNLREFVGEFWLFPALFPQLVTSSGNAPSSIPAALRAAHSTKDQASSELLLERPAIRWRGLLRPLPLPD